MTTPSVSPRRDRWADWAVVGVVALALLLGWWLRDVALYRTVDFALDDAGIAGCSPSGWVWQTGVDPLWRARDPLSGNAATTLELRQRPLAPEAGSALALDTLALERAVNVDLYKTLSTDHVLVQGQTALQRAFTYVEVDHSPYVDKFPEVVRGVDVALLDGARVIIVTYLDDADTFDENYRYFRTFIDGLEY